MWLQDLMGGIMVRHDNVVNNIIRKAQELRYVKEGEVVLGEDYNKKYLLLLDFKKLFDELIEKGALEQLDVLNYDILLSLLSEKKYGDYVLSRDWSSMSKAILELNKIVEKLRAIDIVWCIPNYDGNIYALSTNGVLFKIPIINKIFGELNKYNYKLCYYAQDYEYRLIVLEDGAIYVYRFDIENGNIVRWKEILSYVFPYTPNKGVSGFPPIFCIYYDDNKIYCVVREETNDMLCLRGWEILVSISNIIAGEHNAKHLRSVNNVILLTNEDHSIGYIYDLDGNFLFNYMCSLSYYRQVSFAISTRDGRIVCIDSYWYPRSYYESRLRVFTRDGVEIVNFQRHATGSGDLIIWKPNDIEYIVWVYKVWYDYYGPDDNEIFVINSKTYDIVFVYNSNIVNYWAGGPRACANNQYISVIMNLPKGNSTCNIKIRLIDLDSNFNIVSSIDYVLPHCVFACSVPTINAKLNGYINNIAMPYKDNILYIITRNGFSYISFDKNIIYVSDF